MTDRARTCLTHTWRLARVSVAPLGWREASIPRILPWATWLLDRQPVATPTLSATPAWFQRWQRCLQGSVHKQSQSGSCRPDPSSFVEHHACRLASLLGQCLVPEDLNGMIPHKTLSLCQYEVNRCSHFFKNKTISTYAFLNASPR